MIGQIMAVTIYLRLKKIFMIVLRMAAKSHRQEKMNYQMLALLETYMAIMR